MSTLGRRFRIPRDTSIFYILAIILQLLVIFFLVRENKKITPKPDQNLKGYMAICPNKVRVGGNGDSGKITCNPEKVKYNCTFLSLGLNNQIEYDVEIQKITEQQQCKILGADLQEQKIWTIEKYRHIRGKLFIGHVPETLKIYTIMVESGSKEVEILKMDIESGEHEALEPFLKRFHVCQILIEIHGVPAKQLEMLQKISKLGFRLFAITPNPLCHICCEYSYINEACMGQFGVFPLGHYIPY